MKKDKNVDFTKLNETIGLTNKILKIAFFLVLAVAIYAVILILSELGVITVIFNVFKFLFNFLKIIAPFFIGFLIAWLFDPLVKRITKNKYISRMLGTFIVYIGLLLIVYLFFAAAIPVFINQLNEFIDYVPSIITSVGDFVNKMFDGLRVIDGLDVDAMIKNVYLSIEDFSTSLTTDLPNVIITFVRTTFSGLGTVLIGFLIGFYMLFDFDRVKRILIGSISPKIKKDTLELMDEINLSLRRFVKGTLLVAGLIFVGTFIGFLIIGLQAPLLFAMFCGVTNIIPYVGPYLGGAPAVIVAFSQGVPIGIFVIIVIVVIQLIEGYVIQPLVMGKAMKLHPLIVIIGLLVFGKFFGIVGMIIATPVISILRILYLFIKRKIDFKKILNIFKS